MRKLQFGLALLLFIVFMPGSAQAQVAGGIEGGYDTKCGVAYEGCWHSYINGWSTCCHDSRTWIDKNVTTGSTIVQFGGCSEHNGASFSSTDVQLTRETSFFQPDENRGVQRLQCSVQDYGDWSRQLKPGNYHFTVVKINGTSSGFYQLDVDDVDVQF